MKKIVVFIKQILLVLVLVIIAMLLLNKQQLKHSAKPVVFGSPYAGGPGGGSASAIWSGRIDGK